MVGGEVWVWLEVRCGVVGGEVCMWLEVRCGYGWR